MLSCMSRGVVRREKAGEALVHVTPCGATELQKRVSTRQPRKMLENKNCRDKNVVNGVNFLIDLKVPLYREITT